MGTSPPILLWGTAFSMTQPKQIETGPSQPRLKTLIWRYTCRTCSVRLIWLFGVLALINFIAAFVLPYVIRQQILKGIWADIVIDSTSAAGYADWQDSTRSDAQPTYFQLYFFDVTNPDDILTKGSKPILVQKGPYSYREYKIRFGVEWQDDGELLQFKTQTYYVFDPATSGQGLTEADNVTNVDLALVALHNQIMTEGGLPFPPDFVMRLIMCNALGATPFHTRTVKDLFWGYDNDPVLTAAAMFVPGTPTSFPSLQPNMSSLSVADATSNIDVIHTGKKHHDLIFQFVKYQNMNSMHSCTSPKNNSLTCPLYQAEWTDEQALQVGWTKTWGSDAANAIVGTDATQFARPVDQDQLLVFVDALDRSVNLTNNGGETTDDLFEIEMRRYRLRSEDLLNGTTNTNNVPYYMNGPRGVLNFTSVVGFPFFVTKPHFLDCDERLMQSVEGLSPNHDLHDTIVDVEGFSGIAMRASKRLQFSSVLTNWNLGDFSQADIQQQHAVFNTSSLKDPNDCNDPYVWRWNYTSLTPDSGLFIPYVWIDENEQLTSDQANDFKSGVYSNKRLADDLFVYFLVAFGGCTLASLLVAWAYYMGRRDERKTRYELSEGLIPSHVNSE
eukprot:c5816_g1_i1.p1 GENE.c5816_g1_i1~~c5816_g1_i1.p1  ORF type:complete len:614 (+),score=145.27 c5816_g1_i1:1-1842(+)